MVKPQLRLRFQMIVPLSPEGVLNRLRLQLEKPETEFIGTVASGSANLKIPPSLQHYWSPELSVAVEEHEEGTLVRCLFGPRPAVWTMFASFYGLNIFIIVMGIVFGYSQWSLDQTPYGFWIIPFALVFLGAAYVMAYIGQRMGYEQMLLLRSFLDGALNMST